MKDAKRTGEELIAVELWLDKGDKTHFKIETKGDLTFAEANKAMRNFRDMLNWQIDNAKEKCPFYEKSKAVLKIPCGGSPYIVLEVLLENMPEGGYTFPKDPREFIGFAMHAVQQGQAERLLINGCEVEALLMDQTCGEPANYDDIYKVKVSVIDALRAGRMPHAPMQRLVDITSDSMKPA